MQPIGVDHRRGKGLMVLHRCQKCGHRAANRLALDDPNPDSAEAIGRLMAAVGVLAAGKDLPRLYRSGRDATGRVLRQRPRR
jgi:hypothetical protein